MLEVEEATTMTMRCGVLIWSSRPAFVRAMRSLAYREGLEVLGIARTTDAALRCVEAHRPDAVLVDRETEEQHPHVVVQLMGAGAHTKVVAIDLVDEAVLVLEARRVSTATVRDLVEVIQGHPTPQAA
jgi:AmiR/NasT family two-component response regulator